MAFICLTLLFLAGISVGRELAGREPLGLLKAEEVQWAQVRLVPPDESRYLTREEIGQLVPLLNRIVTHRQDDSYQDYSGQAVTFTIKIVDGPTTTVMAYNPFVVIDGVGYQTEYTPCEALSQFGNSLLRR